MFEKKFQRKTLVRASATFFALDAEDLGTLIFRACHVYATKRAIDIQRATGKVIDAYAAERLLWEGHRTAQMFHKGLATRYRKVSPIEWSDI